MILTYRPLQLPWGQDETKPRARRSRSTFKAGWNDTLQLLDRELSALKATAVVLQVDVTETQIRLDGGLRANVTPGFPGVRLIADTRMGPLSWQTDSCVFWRHNVRSIALGLEALRAVDRYGITNAGEQYKGWLQIEAGTSTGMPTNRAQAAEVLSRISGVHIDADESKQSATARWKAARAIAHPDRNNGARDLWDQVEAAAQLLGLDQP